MRTIVLVAMLLLPVGALADDAAGGAIAVGDRLAESGMALDLKAAIVSYKRAIELDGEGTEASRIAAGRIAQATQRLHELAQPARERVSVSLAAGDYIEAERNLCDAIAIDPFDREARGRLGVVRARLRREAAELHRTILKIRVGLSDSLGVPPGFEFMTNDPRFALPAPAHHRG